MDGVSLSIATRKKHWILLCRKLFATFAMAEKAEFTIFAIQLNSMTRMEEWDDSPYVIMNQLYLFYTAN
jgi:hypothetical protein